MGIEQRRRRNRTVYVSEEQAAKIERLGLTLGQVMRYGIETASEIDAASSAQRSPEPGRLATVYLTKADERRLKELHAELSEVIRAGLAALEDDRPGGDRLLVLGANGTYHWLANSVPGRPRRNVVTLDSVPQEDGDDSEDMS